jgi:hypothetical protein
MDELDEPDEPAFRQLLARHEEPALAQAARLSERVRAKLPEAAPPRALRQEQARLARRRVWAGVLLAGLLVLLSLGAWSVLIDSSLPVRTLGGSGLDKGLLALTLLAKPLVSTLASVGPLPYLIGALMLLVGGLLWWLLLDNAQSTERMRGRR